MWKGWRGEGHYKRKCYWLVLLSEINIYHCLLNSNRSVILAIVTWIAKQGRTFLSIFTFVIIYRRETNN